MIVLAHLKGVTSLSHQYYIGEISWSVGSVENSYRSNLIQVLKAQPIRREGKVGLGLLDYPELLLLGDLI